MGQRTRDGLSPLNLPVILREPSLHFIGCPLFGALLSLCLSTEPRESGPSAHFPESLLFFDAAKGTHSSKILTVEA